MKAFKVLNTLRTLSSPFLQIKETPGNMDQEDPKSSLEAPLISNTEISECNRRSEVVTELKKQLCLAGPLVMVSFLQASLLMISVMFIGHLGELSLASSSMASSFSGVTGFSFMVRLSETDKKSLVFLDYDMQIFHVHKQTFVFFCHVMFMSRWESEALSKRSVDKLTVQSSIICLVFTCKEPCLSSHSCAFL